MRPLAGIGWLKNALNLGRHNPKAIFGGAGLILVLAMLPSLVTVPLHLVMVPGPRMLGAILSISVVAGIALMPLIGGYLGVIDASEHGRPARALDVFAAYRRGGEGLRLIGFGLAMLGLYVVAIAAIAAAAGTGVFTWYLQVLAISAEVAAADPAALTQLPEGLGMAIALGFVLWLLLSGVYAIGFGQVAIGGRSVVAAVGDGLIGSLKNLVPLLVMVVLALLGLLVLMLVVALVVALLAFLATMAGASWLVVALVVPVYVAMLLAMYVVIFGLMYHIWRDVCGGRDEHEVTAEALSA